jgi:hypothetical protein
MVTVREVEDKDFTPLAEFMARGFPDTLAKGFPYITKEFWFSMFEFWWASNPACTDQFPRGWVLENESTIVGFLGNIPIKILFFGESKIAAAANTWYVDPSARGLSSLRLYDKFVKQKSVALLLSRAVDLSYATSLMSKYKFEKYILPVSQKEYVYIINKKKVVYNFFNFLITVRISGLSELLVLYKKLGLLIWAYAYQKPVVRGGVLPHERYISSLCTSCDDAFSRIWKPYLNSHDISLSRDTKTLNWLYFSSARLSTRLVIQCRRESDKTLAGYMVFDIQRVKPSDVGTLHLMEMCIEDDNPEVLASLLSCAIETGKQNRVSLLVVWANSRKTEEYFRKTFSLRRAAIKHRYFRFSDTPDTASVKKEKGVALQESMTWIKCISF